jgi:hypothetical protein
MRGARAALGRAKRQQDVVWAGDDGSSGSEAASCASCQKQSQPQGLAGTAGATRGKRRAGPPSTPHPDSHTQQSTTTMHEQTPPQPHTPPACLPAAQRGLPAAPDSPPHRSRTRAAAARSSAPRPAAPRPHHGRPPRVCRRRRRRAWATASASCRRWSSRWGSRQRRWVRGPCPAPSCLDGVECAKRAQQSASQRPGGARSPPLLG